KKVSEAKAKRQEAGTSGGKSTVISEVLEDVFGANRKYGISVACSALQTRQSKNEEKINTIQTEVTSLGFIMGGVEGAIGREFDTLQTTFFMGILTEGRLINTMANPTDFIFFLLF
ncbi:hypothetical protein MKW98_009592, partial [Papaver atlanticum]